MGRFLSHVVATKDGYLIVSKLRSNPTIAIGGLQMVNGSFRHVQYTAPYSCQDRKKEEVSMDERGSVRAVLIAIFLVAAFIVAIYVAQNTGRLATK
jgi:hypothetical protein